MSLFSQIHCESAAQDLLEILESTIKTNDSSIIKFVKEKIYPLWLSYVTLCFRNMTEKEKNISEFYEKDIPLTFIKK